MIPAKLKSIVKLTIFSFEVYVIYLRIKPDEIDAQYAKFIKDYPNGGIYRA